MKKLSLFLAALCCVMAINAKTIYFNAGSWNTDGNKFAIWSWSGSEAGSWSEFMTSVEDGIFKADIDDAKSSCLFVSFKSDAAAPDWDAKLQQTGDLTVPADLNLYTLTTNSWSTYGTEVAVTGVALDIETLKIRPAQTYTLKATVAPAGASNSAVTWESTDPTVATIDNGKLTTLKVGTTNITVTTVEGGKTATCAVTVSEDEDALKGITIHVTAPATWTKVYGYTFLPEYLGSWPGTELTTQDSEGRYIITFDATIQSVNLIINNGDGGTGNQTQDLNNITADACYTIGDDGKATAIDCGTGEKPEPTPKEYYLVGFINGEDYAGQDYKFVDGKATVTFTATSYVYVADNNGTAYNTESYIDATTATSGEGVFATGKSEKIGVPAGNLTFTLVENEDGTLTISFTMDGSGENPNPTPKEYYLIGFINGANHGDGDDYANLGDYKFTGDPLQVTATFTETSYVCVKTGDPQVWYMATEYVDATTLLEGSVQLTVSSETINEKMGVPGGQELTFTLVENEDGTLTLSFTTADTSDLEYNIVNPSKARKIVENGQIYILRDGVRYNVLGAQVQ